MRLSELKRETAAILSRNTDVESPSGEAALLLEAFLGITRVRQLMSPVDEINEDDSALILEKAAQRANHIPMAYITGHKEFWGLDFLVNENVLIPRPDTETLVEEALKEIRPGYRVLDMCTGSGAIGISVKASSEAEVTLSDISPEALRTAGENSRRLVNGSCRLILLDLFSSIDGIFDMILTNPPYLTSEWVESVTDEVRKEPLLALLDRDEDGLGIIREIIGQSPSHLTPGGILMIECDYRQTHDCVIILKNTGFEDIRIISDLSGRERVVRGTYHA